jgi:hypothetical protein
MNPQINNELPPVQPNQFTEQLSPASPEIGGAEAYMERKANVATELDSQNISQPPQMTPAVPVAKQVDPAAPDAASISNLPAIADDNDLPEKEWITKAKEIVARTRNDPYQQNKEVEVMKADYMKKRFNRDIKVTED